MTNPIERLLRGKKPRGTKRMQGTSTGTMGLGNKKKKVAVEKAVVKKAAGKRAPYIPHDDTIGGPTDKWMLMGAHPIGAGHTAIVKVLPDGNHKKCFRLEWISAYIWMVGREIEGMKAMHGVHAPKYISSDATSVTMTDAGVHLKAGNMPDNWDEQIRTILATLKKAKIKHNDIIPRNIMVKDGVITLIDFSMSTIIGQPYHTPWPNKRLLKVVMRDADEVMLRRAINFILGRQVEWKEVVTAMAHLGTKLSAGSTTHQGKLYHDVPFSLQQVAHRKNTGHRAMAMQKVYDFKGKVGLDVGSSVGGISFWLNRFGANMTGVERDPQAVRVADALKNYYDIKEVSFCTDKINNISNFTDRYDFICYLSTFMWLLKEEGLEGAKASLKRIGKMTDTLFFETSHGDAMAGGAVIRAGLNDKAKMDALVKECTGMTKMKELFIDKGWNNRRLVMFTR